MIKSGVFKKVVALVAALTLVCAFAIGASAATITTTTTTYNADASKVDVVVNVTATANAQVTYYAVNAAANATATQGVVFVDQTTANESGVATFNFTTEAAYLESDVLVGETGVADAGEGAIDGNSIAMTGSSTDAYVIPNAETTATKVFAYSFGYNRTLDAVEAENATVTEASYSEGAITVVLADIEGDVTLTVTEKPVLVETVVATNHAGAGIIAAEDSEIGDENDEFFVTAGDKKLSVLGQITGMTEDREFGVVISVDEIEEGTFDSLANTYKAMGKADSGHFAIQVIDAEIEVTDYNTAVYYVNADGKYVVSGVSVASFAE